MHFNTHSDLVGLHAFLSASKYHWINYDDEKLVRVFTAQQAAKRGTDLHALAHEMIRLGVKLPDTPTTMNLYVNDAIGFRMATEVLLFHSINAFGTADTICFRKNKLRIHDLKTGLSPASVRQLEVYAALFCLEYGHDPAKIEIELRIYQNDEAVIYDGDPVVIKHIMDRIISADKILNSLRLEAMS